MENASAACNLTLVVHGAIVLLLANLAGYVFFRVINASPADATRTNMWRMSHAATSTAAVFLLALGPIVPHLHLDPMPVWFFVGVTIGSTYALCLGTLLAGASGHRGTKLRRPWSNLVVYVLYVLGALGSTVAGIALLYGAVGAWLAS
jgi:hypothetical protein